MKICHVVSSLLVGGAEMVALRLAQAQRDAGHDVAILALAGGPLEATCAEAGLRRDVLAGASGARRAAAAVGYFLRTRPDVVNSHNPSANRIGRLARAALFPVVTLTLHGETSAAKVRPVGRLAVDGIIACSARVGEVFRGAHAGFAAARLAVIDNGVAVGKAASPEPAPRPPGPPVVICVARLDPLKDLGTLIRAVVSLPDAELVLVGDGAERPALEELVASLGAAAGRRVRFLGFRRDVAALLAGADVFALSSVTEGLPISVLEAMAAGLPVVATAVGGTPDVVVEGETGLLVPPRDPDALARALATLLGDPARRATLGRAARARVEERYSLEAMARRYVEAYEAFAAARRRL